eukprot:jgi/Chrzof1/1555/Cz10g12090.t1
MSPKIATGKGQELDLGDDPHINVESRYLTELNEQKNELLQKVQVLRKDLEDWRSKLETQVKNYKTEIGDLRQALNTEVDTLRSEFMDLKAALKQQLDLTASLSQLTHGSMLDAGHGDSSNQHYTFFGEMIADSLKLLQACSSA